MTAGPPTDGRLTVTTDVLQTVEMFGPTVQGEGPDVGRAAMFLRLAGCNLTCAWCDTSFTWDPNRPDPHRPPRVTQISEILTWLDPRASDPEAAEPAVTRLVITGGEPLLQARGIVELAVTLRQLGWIVEVETSGTVSPGELAELVDRFNVSPKLAHSGVAERARLRSQVLAEFAAHPGAIFKFVAEQVTDLDEVATIISSVGLEPSRVFVMAQATTADDVLLTSRDLVDAVVARGWGLTPRWHTLLWGDQPGR